MSPFDTLTDKEKEKLIEGLNGHIYYINKGDEIITLINTKNMIGIILEGSAKLILNSYTGEEILIEEYKKDSIFGTNISDINNIDTKMFATDLTKVVVIDYSTLIGNSLNQRDYYNTFIKNLFRIMIERSNSLNQRLRILTKKSIRDRIIEYFDIEKERKHSNVLYLSMSLKDSAG